MEVETEGTGLEKGLRESVEAFGDHFNKMMLETFEGEDGKEALIEYWRKRCLAAEEYIKESPCDPDITNEQAEAYFKWQDIKKDILSGIGE